MFTIIVIGLAGFLFMSLQQKVYQRLWQKNLSVDVRFASDHMFEGETGELKETIENRKRLPLAMLRVKFMTDRHLVFGSSSKGSRTTDNYYRNDVFCVGGGERVIRTLRFKGGKRGYYTIKELNLAASDLFFMYQMNAEMPAGAKIYVYPRPYESSELQRALITLNGDMITRRHLLEDPFAYRGIREYQPYDDLRSINWKATAKTGELKVNQRHYTSLKSARVFFDVQPDSVLQKEEAVEMTLRLAAAVCSSLLRQGLEVSCFGNGADILNHEPVTVRAKAGVKQMDHIYRVLARVDAAQSAVPFAQIFENTVFEGSEARLRDETLTCFVTSFQNDSFLELLGRYQREGHPFLWFYPVQQGHPRPKLPALLTRHICVLYMV